MNFLDMYYPNMSQADRRRFNLARQQELMNRQLRTQTSGLPMYRDSLLGRGAVGPLQRRDAMQSAVADMQAAMAAAPATVAPATGLLSAADVRPMARPYDFSDVTDEISRKPQPAKGLLGRIGEGLRGVGEGLRGAGQELGGLFQGPEGQLRARELSKALMTGPTSAPVSFGQSLVEGLAAGGEAVEAARAEQAKIDMALAKIAAETAEKQQKELEQSKAARSKAYAVVAGVDDAMTILDEYSDKLIGATGFASVLKNIPTTGANRLNLALETIKAQLGFAELNAMRQASPTGGALGQVTVRELDFLQRTIKALETELPAKDLRANLMEVRNVMMAIANGVEDPRVGRVISLDEKLELDSEGKLAPSSPNIPNFNPQTGEIEPN